MGRGRNEGKLSLFCWIVLYFWSTIIFPVNAVQADTTEPAKEEQVAASQEGGEVTITQALRTDRYIIKYKKNKEDQAREGIQKAGIQKVKSIHNLNKSQYDLVITTEKMTDSQFDTALKASPEYREIEYIQPDYVIEMASNDPHFPGQWGIQYQSPQEGPDPLETGEAGLDESTQGFDANIVPAWNETRGQNVLVAVIDSGIDTAHEDLQGSIWTNTSEVPDNDIDDDNNGYIDDIQGWNFNDTTRQVHDPANTSDEWHGTHLAGIIRAQTDNGLGVAGVAPDAKIMPLKVFQNGTAYTSDIINAIEYASLMDASIVNCSWGSTQYNQALYDNIQSHPEMLFVAAAGNNGQDLDSNPVYPAAFPLDNIITAASISSSGILSPYSNYSVNAVDVAAPGDDIVSTLPDNQYGPCGGTSMAAAFVSGEAALVLGRTGALTPAQVKSNIMTGCDRLSSLEGKVNNYGKINCYQAVMGIDASNSPLIQVNASNESSDSTSQTGEEYTLYSAPQWQDVADMPTNRQGMATAVCKGKIYAIGGYTTSGAVTNKVEMYDPATNTWIAKANLPTKIHSLGVTVLSGKIYAIGGRDAYDVDLNTVYAYNPDSNSWAAKASLPTPRRGVGVAAANGKVYAMGGTYYSADYADNIYLSETLEYDPTANTWTTKANMPTARTTYAAAVDGKIFAIGGATSSGAVTTVQEYNPAYNSWHYQTSIPNSGGTLSLSSNGALIYCIHSGSGGVTAFDPSQDQWTTLTSGERSKMGAAFYAGKLYGLGGNIGSATLKSVRTLDVEPNGWGLRPYMVSQRSSFGTGAVGSTVYIIGGYKNGCLATVEEYNADYTEWTTKASMSVARAALGVAEAGGKLYAIGGYDGSQYLNTVEEYNPSTNTWTVKTNMPTPRCNVAVASYNGKVYAIGGYNGTYLGTVEEYDPSTNTWTTKTNMPTPRTRMAVTVVAGKIYLMGGYKDGWLDTVERYNPVTDIWGTRTPLPEARDQLGAARVSGIIYVMGGYHNGQYDSNVTICDPIKNAWEQRTSMPTPRYNLGAVAVNGKILTFGGYSTTVLKCVQEYDPSKDKSESEKWVKKANMPTATFELGVAAVGGKIYALGGLYQDGLSTFYNYNQVYDLSTDTWSTGTAMPDKRYGFGAAVVNDKIYAVAGKVSAGSNKQLIMYDPATSTWTTKANCGDFHQNPGTAVVDGKIFVMGGGASTSTEMYNPTSNTWTYRAAVPAAIGKAGAVAYNGKIYLIGGQDSSSNPLNTVYEYNPQTNTWVTKANMPTARYGLIAVEIDGSIYAMGGSNATPYLDIIEKYDPVANTWSNCGSMPEAKSLMGCTTMNNKLYVIGGKDIYGACNYVHEYSPAIGTPAEQQPNTWRTMAAMPTSRDRLGVTALNDAIYAVGGRDAAGSALANLEKYDATTDSWSAMTSLNTARHSLGTAALSGKLYAIGGSNGSYLGTTEEYSPSTNAWSVKASMPTPRNELAVVPMNGKLYAIGGYNGQSYLNTVEEYDPQTNTWTAKAAMPTARSQFGAGVINGKIYAAGGFNGSNLITVEEYDPATNSWTAKASLATPRRGAAVSSFNGRIFVCSGYNTDYLTDMEVFDPMTNQWETKTGLSPSCAYMGLAPTNGKLYAIGGSIAGSSVTLNQNEQYLPDNYAPEPGALKPDAWVTMADMPFSCSGIAAAALNGVIYVAGGEKDLVCINKLEKYNSKTNTWQSAANIPTARKYAGMTVLDGKIYLAGGENNGVLNQLEVYDPVTDTWTSKNPMPTARSHLALVAANNRLYAVGGTNGSQSLATVEAYDPSTNTWIALSSMSALRSGLAAVALNGQLVVAGGYNGSTYLNSVEQYNPDTNTWSSKASMASARADLGAIAVNGKIYAVGGYNGSEYLNNLEVYDPSTNTWAVKTSMLTARSGIGTAESGWEIYVVGGWNGAYLNTVERYTTLYDSYQYSDSNRLETIKLSSGGVVTYEYDDNGNLTSRSIVQN